MTSNASPLLTFWSRGAFVYRPPMPDFIVVEDDLPTATTTTKPRSLARTHARANADARNHRMGKDLRVPKPSEAPDVIPEDADAALDDLAATVVSKSLRALAAGKLAPTLKDGLQAQTILDRRAEKAADRRFMLNLAQAMAGGGYAPPQKLLPSPDETVIEGDFTEEDAANLAPAHLRSEP